MPDLGLRSDLRQPNCRFGLDLAEEGSHVTKLVMTPMFEQGQRAGAFMWLTLAASQGAANATQYLQALAPQMTADKRAEGCASRRTGSPKGSRGRTPQTGGSADALRPTLSGHRRKKLDRKVQFLSTGRAIRLDGHQGKASPMELVWDGITRSATVPEPDLRVRQVLAAAAKSYDWTRVIAVLSEHPKLVNTTRPDGCCITLRPLDVRCVRAADRIHLECCGISRPSATAAAPLRTRRGDGPGCLPATA